MWSKKNYLDAGQKIGEDFVASDGGKSINSLATKVAQKNNLDPEAIRTVVRIANNAAFQGLFQKSASAKKDNRMIEFEVGDPEVVITKLQRDAGEKIAAATLPEEKYSRTADYYGSLEDFSKVAGCDDASKGHYSGQDEAEEPMSDKKMVKKLFKDANGKLSNEKRAAEVRWADNMDKAVQTYRVRITNPEHFYKCAASSLGVDAQIELSQLAARTGEELPDYFGSAEKVAHVVDFNVTNISPEEQEVSNFLKGAQDARSDFDKCIKGIEYLKNNV